MVITIVPATAKNRSITKTPPCVNERRGGKKQGGREQGERIFLITHYQLPITNYLFPLVLLYSYQRMMKKPKAI
jgi:hypothetical protein